MAAVSKAVERKSLGGSTPSPSAVNIHCPTCNQPIAMYSAPVKGKDVGNEAWICLYCRDVVCVHCYHEHVEKKHQDILRQRKTFKK